MGFFLRGALVEYGTDFLGPLPNIVVFQFNPEQIARTLNLPPRAGAGAQDGSRDREPNQLAGSPRESLQITAHFSAADDLGKDGAAAAIPRIFGVGPQLAALEKMVYPSSGLFSGLIGDAIDAVGDALGFGGDEGAAQPRPREQAPRILFVWGPARVLPVEIQSMSITEQKFDSFLNPVQAEVQIGMMVALFPPDSDDKIGQGALEYTQTVKDAQAVLNLAKAVELAVETIPF